MHNIKLSETPQDTALGPTPMSQVTLDSAPVQALLDTGSPISTVSLEFYLKPAAQNRTSQQTPAEWGEEVLKKLMPTTVSLRSYGEDEIEIVSQAICHLERDGYQVKTILPSSEEDTSGPATWNRCLKSTGFHDDASQQAGCSN